MAELTIGQKAAARYAMEQLAQIREVVAASQLPFLAYLIDMAATEAAEINQEMSLRSRAKT